MNNPKEHKTSIYSTVFDKEVPQAGYAAIAFTVIALWTGLLRWIGFFNETPGGGGGHHESFHHTPFVIAVTVGLYVIIAAIPGTLAFFIFRRSRFAVVAMLLLVILPQLYTWFVARSIAGSLTSIIIAAFLARGARRIFQDHAEQKMEAEKV
jgi:hypothetical protein